MLRTFYFIGFFFILVLHAHADQHEWTVSERDMRRIVGAENQIVKWCREDGSPGVRYASANIDLSGYKRCGELEASLTCDATGRKFITKGKTPHGYQNCDVGPRIYIERDGEPLKPTTEVAAPDRSLDDLNGILDGSSQPIQPMSPGEQDQFEKELAKLGKNRGDFSATMSRVLSQYLGQQPGQDKKGARARRNRGINGFEGVLKSLDPQSKKLVEQYFGISP